MHCKCIAKCHFELKMQFDSILIFTGSFIYSWLPFNENEELDKLDHLAYSIKHPALCML